MILHVVKYGNQEEGYDIWGIYSTKVKADAVRDLNAADRSLLEWEVEEFELDKDLY